MENDNNLLEKVIKELGFENKQLTDQDLSQMFSYMQEMYSL